MSVKCLGAVGIMAALLAPGVFVGNAYAQKTPAPGTHWTVSKNADDMANFSTIQAAVNAAQPGQVIEILDEAVYEEQVTIDGRLNGTRAPGESVGTHHYWRAGVIGGKNGITLRYVPRPGVTERPTIRYQDVTNRSPDTRQQALTPGDTVGSSGNFETCGALRIIRADKVTIEGIRVNGGGAAPFLNPNVWCNALGTNCEPLFHGNAAIAVVISGNVQIRDCVLDSAYFGIHVKDRNTGGVFGNPAPADNDHTIPLSGFGKTGNHLFEYNKIGGNHVGISFESLWDRGSTVRYNLIYNNYYYAAMPTGSGNYGISGGMLFKDNYLSPVAIYNNTFNNNYGDIMGHWQIGYQHLIFNNIFGRNNSVIPSGAANRDDMNIIGKFSNRMKHCVFAAETTPAVQPCEAGGYVSAVQFQRFANLMGSATTPFACSQFFSVSSVPAGALLQAASGNSALPADANLRWLEMNGVGSGTASLPVLFQNTDNPAAANFLEPVWTAAEVQNFIRNKGWTAIGTVNETGQVPDIGAIQFGGKRPGDCKPQASRARISPFSVVKIKETDAAASITVTQEAGSPIAGNMTVKYLRWIAPIPDNSTGQGLGNEASFGTNGTVIPVSSVQTPAIAAGSTIAAGSQTVQITLPRPLTTDDKYGFFEVVLANANGIVTDVGFLPYRRLDYELKIELLRNGVVVTPASDGKPVINVGETGLSMRVSAVRSDGTAFNGNTNAGGTENYTNPLNVEYRLLSDPSSRIWQALTPIPNNALVYDSDLRTAQAYAKTYSPVFFTKAHTSEVINASGVWYPGSSNMNGVPFHGALVVSVRPGAPDKVTFIDPVSKKLLPAGVLPPVISGAYDGQVRVEDKFGNPTDLAVPVALKAVDVSVDASTPIGSVAPATSNTVTDGTGIAAFTASVENGIVGDVFELIASINYQGAVSADTARLRVARAADGLRALFVNTYTAVSPQVRGAWKVDLNSERNDRIDTLVGTWVPVWIKAVSTNSSIDTVLTSRSNTAGTPLYICVTPPDPTLLLSADSAGTAAAGQAITVPMTNGVAKVWVSSNDDVVEARLDVRSMRAADCAGTRDNTLTAGRSNPITFFKAVSSILESPDRVLRHPDPGVDVALIAPVNVLAAEFTAGPNPVLKSTGKVGFYRQGKSINKSTLMIFDATGNFINKITIRENAAVGALRATPIVSSAPYSTPQPRRPVGAWNLKDAKGRKVSDGTYLVLGIVELSDGSKEKVSLMIGVR